MKVTFNVKIDGGIIVNSGFTVLYPIIEKESSILPGTQQTGSTFTLDVDDSDKEHPYYYIDYTLYEYTFQGHVYDVRNDGVHLYAVFNPASGIVGINPHATVAACFAFAQMNPNPNWFNIYGSPRSIQIGYGMKNNLVFDNGDVMPDVDTKQTAITLPPNAGETNSYGLFNFFCNMFYYYTTDAEIRDALNELIIGPYGFSKTFQNCMMIIVQNPFTNIKQIYDLIGNKTAIYTPTLSNEPPVFAIALKFNDSGSPNFLVAGTAFVVFDQNDRAWITNNFRQGTPNSGTHCMVFESDGKPAPFSPIMGGGILGPGFGVARHPYKNIVAIGNYGWGTEDNNPAAGSVSFFDSETGAPLSPPNGYTQELSRVQGMCYDNHGNLWMCSWGTQNPMAPSPASVYNFTDQNSAIVVYPENNPDLAVSYIFDSNGSAASPHNGSFSVIMDNEGYALVSNAGNGKNKVCSSVHKMQLAKDSTGSYTLTCAASWTSSEVYNGPKNKPGLEYPGFEDFRQIAVSPTTGNVYVGALITGRIVVLDKNLENQTEIKHDYINAPWGIKLDKKGMMYVANFATGGSSGHFGVAMLDPANPNATKLFSLPTGNSEVKLANGQPLYGNRPGSDGKPMQCFEPLMRLTSTNIDGAGNVWAMNNWKPSVDVDIDYREGEATNPGGDGVVVFLGIATPE